MFSVETGFIKLRSMVTGEYDFVRYDQIKSITSVRISECYDNKPPIHFAIQDATEWTNVGFGEKLQSILHVAEKPAEIHAAIMECQTYAASQKKSGEKQLTAKDDSGYGFDPGKKDCDEQDGDDGWGWDGIKR